MDLRKIYIRVSGTEEWGNNLIPAESSVRAAEEVNMYYEPSAEEGTLYNMQIVAEDGNTYEIYNVELSDMERASLHLEEGSVYLRYLSLSTKNETTTTESDSYDASYEDSSYDSGYYEDSYYDSSHDDSYYDDSYYDDSYYDDGYYDDSYEDGYYDDGSYDDGSYDDGSYDDSGDGTDTGGDYSDGSGGDIVWDEDGNWSEYYSVTFVIDGFRQ